MATVTESPVQAATTEIEPEGLYEFVDGGYVEKTVGAPELELANILAELLNDHVRANRLGRVRVEVTFRLRSMPRLDRRPDVAFVSEETWSAARPIPPGAAWEVAPDLAIEVISPTNRTAADIRKVQEYFNAGTKVVWIVIWDLAMVYVYSSPTEVAILTRGDILDGSPVIPGFTLDLAAFFGPPAGQTA